MYYVISAVTVFGNNTAKKIHEIIISHCPVATIQQYSLIPGFLHRFLSQNVGPNPTRESVNNPDPVQFNPSIGLTGHVRLRT